MIARGHVAGGLVICLALAACGGGAAHAPFALERPEDASAALERAAARTGPIEPVPALAVAVSADGEHLEVFDVRDGSRRWRVAVRLASTPWLAGRHVASLEGDALVLRRLADGEVVARLPARQMALVGAAGDGPWTVVVLSTGGGIGARSRVIAFREGRPEATWRLEQTAGVPWVRGEMAWVPWASQFVSVLSLARGKEVARATLQDARLLQAWGEPGGLFVGGDVAVPWSARLASGRVDAAGGLRVRADALPGRLPTRPDDPSRPPLPPTSAAHRIGLRWWAEQGAEGARLGNGVSYLVFYRVVLALEPRGEDGWRVRWARRLDRDVVAAEAGPRTLWVMLEDGRLLGLCAGQGRLAEVARVQGRFAYARLPRGALPRPAFDERRPPLREQLVAVASARDARTTPVQRFAVARLAEMAGEEGTAALLDLCEASRVPPQVRGDACEALARRNEGAEAVLRALRGRASFLDRRPAPPVGALARAAASMGASEAVPVLLERLEDPATPEQDLPAVAEALARLGGGAEASGALEGFARFYRAEPGPPALARAVAEALRALTEADAERGAALVEEILNEEDTSDAVRSAVALWWEPWLQARREAQGQSTEGRAEEGEGGSGSASPGSPAGVEAASAGGEDAVPGGGAGAEEEER